MKRIYVVIAEFSVENNENSFAVTKGLPEVFTTFSNAKSEAVDSVMLDASITAKAQQVTNNSGKTKYMLYLGSDTEDIEVAISKNSVGRKVWLMKRRTDKGRIYYTTRKLENDVNIHSLTAK